jgi:hypothetical protein
MRLIALFVALAVSAFGLEVQLYKLPNAWISNQLLLPASPDVAQVWISTANSAAVGFRLVCTETRKDGSEVVTDAVVKRGGERSIYLLKIESAENKVRVRVTELIELPEIVDVSTP